MRAAAHHRVWFPRDGAGALTVAAGTPVRVNAMESKGYEINIGGWTGNANLEGSVAGHGQWTVISAVNVGTGSVQGAVADQYNWFRINVVGLGGTEPEVTVTG